MAYLSGSSLFQQKLFILSRRSLFGCGYFCKWERFVPVGVAYLSWSSLSQQKLFILSRRSLFGCGYFCKWERFVPVGVAYLRRSSLSPQEWFILSRRSLFGCGYFFGRAMFFSVPEMCRDSERVDAHAQGTRWKRIELFPVRAVFINGLHS